MPPPSSAEFEEVARRGALRWFLEGNEEGALDLLRAAREMAR